jgi:hypothetical protein
MRREYPLIVQARVRSTRDCQTGAAVGLFTSLPGGDGCGTSFPFPHPLGPSSQREWAHIPIVDSGARCRLFSTGKTFTMDALRPEAMKILSR